jgi:F-type H+-transporting ATPase subunit delta
MEEIAQVYARALFEVAKEHGALDEIREQLDQFADALHENRDLAIFFFSPYFSAAEKEEGLRRAIAGADPRFLNFLEALIERHRMPAIFRIRDTFNVLWEEEHRQLRVEVTTAVPLDESIVKEIGERIGEQTDHEVDLSSHVDPDILGGIVLRVGNFILDASIQNRLNQLRKQVAQA